MKRSRSFDYLISRYKKPFEIINYSKNKIKNIITGLHPEIKNNKTETKVNYSEKKSTKLGGFLESKSKEKKKSQISNNQFRGEVPTKKSTINKFLKKNEELKSKNKTEDKPSQYKMSELILKFRSEEQKNPQNITNVYSKNKYNQDHTSKLMLSKKRRIEGKIKSQDFYRNDNFLILNPKKQNPNAKQVTMIQPKKNEIHFGDEVHTDRLIQKKDLRYLINKRKLTSDKKTQENHQGLGTFRQKSIPTAPNITIKKISLKKKLYNKGNLTKFNSKFMNKPCSLSPDHISSNSKTSNHSRKLFPKGRLINQAKNFFKKKEKIEIKKNILSNNSSNKQVNVSTRKIKLYKTSQKFIKKFTNPQTIFKKNIKISSNKEFNNGENQVGSNKVNNTNICRQSLEKNLNVKKNFSQPKKFYRVTPTPRLRVQKRGMNPQGQLNSDLRKRRSAINKFISKPRENIFSIHKKKNRSAETPAENKKIKNLNLRKEYPKLLIPKMPYLKSTDKKKRFKLQSFASKSKEKKKELEKLDPRKKVIYQQKKYRVTSQISPNLKTGNGKLANEVKSFEVNQMYAHYKPFNNVEELSMPNFSGKNIPKVSQMDLKNNILPNKTKYSEIKKEKGKISRVRQDNNLKHLTYKKNIKMKIKDKKRTDLKNKSYESKLSFEELKKKFKNPEILKKKV